VLKHIIYCLKLFYPISLICSLLYFSHQNKVFATWEKYHANPVLSHGSPGEWDSGGAISSSIVFDGFEYQMWYSTSEGSPGKIGYATSSDGINWVKSLANPIIIPNNTIDGETNVMDPYVILDEGVYKMWYTSVRPYTGSGNEVYRIAYTSTTDPINWPPGQLVLRAVASSWESEGVAQASVAKVDNIYKQWYAARDSSGSWKIGYADSLDGINWNKNLANPILFANQPSWEYSHIGGPRGLIIDQNIYNLWYHAGPVVPYNIAFAYSPNGITNWVKPSNENPILTRGSTGSFDQTYLANPFVLKVGNDYRMWYSGFNGQRWQIGLASNVPSPTPTPTPAMETTKVIVVPGMGGSWSAAILSCELDLPGTWVPMVGTEEIYNPLIEEIQQRGFTALPFYYDWRKPIPSRGTELATFIDESTQPGEKVMLVGHSMGGLVGRAYLTQEGANNKLDHFMTVGSPHRGAPQSYAALSGGELWTDESMIKKAEFLIKKWCAGSTKSDREVYTNLVPSFYDILPIEDYLRDQKSGTLKPVGSMQLQNSWLPGNNFSSPFFGVTVGALSGNAHQTIQNISVKDRNKVDQLLGDWADGKPTQKEKIPAGDGTVLASSSMIPGATNIPLDKDHSELISSSDGVGEIMSFLGLGETNLTAITNYEEPESTLAIIADPGWFWVTDPSGKTVGDTQGLIVISNTQNGNYKFKLIPKTFGSTRIAVAQFLKNGNVLWKDYYHKGILPKFGSLNINVDTPTEDVLH